MKRAIAGLVALGAVFAAAPALAADCQPLRYLTGLPITFRGGSAFIPVTINDTDKSMLLDTGGVTSQLTHDAAETLKLQRIEAAARLYDINGNLSDERVRVAEFGLGSLKGHDLPFHIAPAMTSGDSDVAGLIALDVMGAYDVDMDFGSNRLNYFSPKHCAGSVYWPNDVVAVIPMQLSEFHIKLLVTLDGHQLPAMLDTGASRTLVTMATAKRLFDFVPDQKDVIGFTNGDKNLPMYAHDFSSLSFGGITINHPHMGVVDQKFASKDVNNNYSTGSHISRHLDDLNDTEVIIGLDTIRKFHIFVAFSENKLYVAAASAKDAASLPPVYDPKAKP
jgi:predicted aspartyl protease